MTDAIVQTAFGDIPSELANTRKMIAAVPDDHYDWKPHDKSATLGGLANHIVQMVGWGPTIMQQTGLDFGKPMPPLPKATNTAELLAQLDKNIADMERVMSTATADDLKVEWALSMGDQVFMKGPRSMILRGLYMSHIVHHRAQLSIYLRMLDIPMPGMYGPSADEK